LQGSTQQVSIPENSLKSNNESKNTDETGQTLNKTYTRTKQGN